MRLSCGFRFKGSGRGIEGYASVRVGVQGLGLIWVLVSRFRVEAYEGTEVMVVFKGPAER